MEEAQDEVKEAIVEEHDESVEDEYSDVEFDPELQETLRKTLGVPGSDEVVHNLPDPNPAQSYRPSTVREQEEALKRKEASEFYEDQEVPPSEMEQRVEAEKEEDESAD